LYNSNATVLKEPFLSFVAVVDEPFLPGLSVLNLTTGAGFYSDTYGPLPFVIGFVPDDRFLTQRVEAEPAASK
jgi:hypothetical protein